MKNDNKNDKFILKNYKKIIELKANDYYEYYLYKIINSNLYVANFLIMNY